MPPKTFTEFAQQLGFTQEYAEKIGGSCVSMGLGSLSIDNYLSTYKGVLGTFDADQNWIAAKNAVGLTENSTLTSDAPAIIDGGALSWNQFYERQITATVSDQNLEISPTGSDILSVYKDAKKYLETALKENRLMPCEDGLYSSIDVPNSQLDTFSPMSTKIASAPTPEKAGYNKS